jgi:hypothetical protein
MKENCIPKRILNYGPYRGRNVGRHIKRWLDKEILKEMCTILRADDNCTI